MIVTLLLVQPDWVENAENSVKRINTEGKLELQFEKNKKDGVANFKKYIAKNGTRFSVKYQIGKAVDVDISYYENDKLLFAEITNGIDILLYKEKRKPDEPYAILIDKIVYFKDENEGIRKIRKLDIYENSNIKKLKSKLKEMNFKTEKIDSTEYKDLKKRYDHIKTIKK